MELTESQVRQFQRDGFLKNGQMLSSEEVDELREELARVIREQDKEVAQPVVVRNLGGNSESVIWQVVNIWEGSEAFSRLVHNEALARAAGQLMGSTAMRVWHDQIQYKPAGKGGVNMWHQDSPLWGILEPKDQQMSAWIALDNVDEGNGCMRMVPGTHRWGPQMEFLRALDGIDGMPDEWNGLDLEVKMCPVAKGEVHFHHALTWHGSHANTSQRPRRAIAIHYMTQNTVYDSSGDHVMKQFAEVADGEKLEGSHFPLVWKAPEAASGPVPKK